MKYKLPLAIGTTVATIGASSVMVFADTSTNSTGRQSLVDKIATKFNLNKADVQKLFDENRQERQTQMEQKYSARLDQAVKDGKITFTQKDQILAKHKELVSFRDSLESKAPTERKQAMQTERQQVEQWAKDNNIPLNLLMPMRHHGMDGPADDTPELSGSDTSNTN